MKPKSFETYNRRIFSFAAAAALGVAFILIITAFSGFAAADEIDMEEEYLQELIDTALEKSFGYQELFYEKEAALSRRDQLESGLDWRGDAMGDLDLQETPEVVKTFYDLTEEDVDDTFASATLSAAISRNLWDDPETAYQREALALDIDDSRLELTRAEQELITAVTEAYYDFRQAQLGVKLAEMAAEVREEQIEEKRALVEAEEATETDLQEVKLEAEEAREDFKEAEEMLNLARENLKLETGADRLPPLPEAEDLTAAEEVDIPEEASPWPWDLHRSREIAREERVDLQRLEQSLDLIEAEMEKVEAERFPDLSGNVLYYQPDMETTFNVELDDTGRLIAAASRTETTLPDVDEIRFEEGEVEEALADLIDRFLEQGAFDNGDGIPGFPGVNNGDNVDIDGGNGGVNENNTLVTEDQNEDLEPLHIDSSSQSDREQIGQQNMNILQDNDNDDNDNENNDEVVVELNEDPDSFWQVSFGVEYNFYDSGLEEAEMEELEAQKQAAREQLKEAEEGIELEVKAQWQDLERAHRKLKLSQSDFELAGRRLSEGEHLLEAEMISKYEYNLMELNYYRSASDLLMAKYDYRQESVEMAEVLGLSTEWYRGEL